MVGAPTFVIGAGGAGIDVLQRLLELEQSQKGLDQDQFAYLGIDSDRETIAQTPNEIPTIHLTGDSGIVGEGLEQYPYLAGDDIIPDDGTNQMRHIGRYKLDNTVPPGMMTHYHELRDRINQFLETNRTSLDCQSDRCNIVVVSALGGGTGSGIHPLLTALLSHIGTHTLSDQLIRLTGIGIIPPLDIEPYYNSPPTDPVTYLNTYAAFRNLSTLLNSSDDQSVTVPAYSLATDLDGILDQSEDMSGIEFEIDTPAFDRYWLVSTAHGSETGSDSPLPTSDVTSMIANTLIIFSSHASAGSDTSIWSRTQNISPLGTVGYAAVEIPHQALEEYCKRKQERHEFENRLKEVIAPRVTSLKDRQEKIAAALETDITNESDKAVEWVCRIRDRLDETTQINASLIEKFSPREVTSVIDQVAEEESNRAGLLASLSLRWALGEGPIGSEIRTELEEIYKDVRDKYAFELVTRRIHRSAPLEDRLRVLQQTLAEYVRYLQNKLSDTESSVQDLLPPTHELFISEREHIQQLIEDLETDFDQVSTAIYRLRSLQTFQGCLDDYVEHNREQVAKQLANTESELDFLQKQRAECRDQLAVIEQELADLRESLTDPDVEGPEFKLPLSWQVLDDVSIETVQSELTSIAAYRKQGMVAVDDDAFETYLERCYTYSQDWPDSIAQHAVGMTMSHTHDETLLRYHKSNESEVEKFMSSLTGLDTLHTPADEEIAFTQDPYRIEIVSISQGGQPESLTGVQRLQEMVDDGTFKAMADSYRNFRRAFAYPEWYDSSIQDAFR